MKIYLVAFYRPARASLAVLDGVPPIKLILTV